MNNINNALLVLIFTDGERIERTIERNGRFAWLVRGLKEFGAEMAQTSEYWSTLVVINGEDVTTYRDEEIREILL